MTTEELNKKYNTNIQMLFCREEVSKEKWEKEYREKIKAILQKEECGTFPTYASSDT